MKILKKIVVFVMVLSLSISMVVPIESAAEESIQTQKAEDGKSVNKSVYEADGFRVTFTLDSQWDSGYNATVKIENKGNKVLHDWYLGFSFGEVISHIWNGEILRYQEGKYIIKNAGWNQDIDPDDSISFGFQASGKFSGYPEKYEIVNGKAAAKDNDYTVKYSLDNDWGTGFTGNISIINNTDTVLEDWSIEFDFDRNITSVWNAEKESQKGTHYVFCNAGYNSDIKPGQTVTFGFVGIDGDRADEPEKFQLYSYQMASDCTVLFDGCGDGIIHVPAVQNVKKGTFAEKPKDPIREGYSFMGWYADKKYSQYFDFETTEVHSNITLYARWLNLMDDKDTDGDGIGDSLEEYIGTNSTRKDTDGDGVSDYMEIVKLDTDPTRADTDGNGISDGEEDFDQDGLSNKLEESYKTDPAVKDTDNDGLSDYEEIDRYQTDPNKEDTDKDSLLDGDEITLGFHPLKIDTDENGVADGNEVIEQKLKFNVKNSPKKQIKSVGVQLSCSGLIDHHVEIEDVSETDTLSANVVGLVGVPINLEADFAFDEAVITFTYDESQLGDTKESNLCIMWYDEANDRYVLLEDSVLDTKNNTISYKTTHFSTYLVVDKERWMDTLKKNSPKNFDIIQWIKDGLFGKENASVYKCYENGMTWDDAKAYCEQMGGHLATITSEDEQAVIESLIQSEGSKNNYWIGAQKSVGSNSFEWVTGEKMTYTKYLGGKPDNYRNQEDAVMIYRNNNPKVWGLCFGYWNDLNRDGTCMGEYFFGLENMGFICEWDDVKVEDTDHDGVMDILEEGYMLSNGQIITSDPEKADTDGDGLSDGEEMGGKPEITTVTTFGKEYVILVWHAKSDPNRTDSDGDGLYDNSVRKAKGITVAPADPEPLKANGPEGIWDTHVMQQEIGAVARAYDTGSSGADMTSMVEELSSAIREAARKENVDVPANEELAAAIVEGILTVRKDMEVLNNITIDDATLADTAAKGIRAVALAIKACCNGKAATVAGAYLLNFVQDADKIAYHSVPDTWQRYFGYNKVYDEVFDIGSYMKYLFINFSTDSKRYMLWMWKGDYWNMHSGAEIGLYTYSDDYSGISQYDAIDFKVPMTLSLYNYYKKDDIDNIFSWSPRKEQWWITGFSGQNENF